MVDALLLRDALVFLVANRERFRPGLDELPEEAAAFERAIKLLEPVPGTRRLIIHGMARTKKNRPIMTRAGYGQQGRAVLLPNKDWVAWAEQARLEYVTPWPDRPMTAAVNCCATYYLTPRQHGDALGYHDGLADLLQLRKVVLNDRQIVTWDGTRFHVDATNPRVEVELEPRPLTL